MVEWYAAYTQPRMEVVARKNLLRQGFEVYLPQFLKKRSHARRVDWVRSPFFPRYVFVGTHSKNKHWRSICSTVGVTSLVKFGEYPTNVPGEIIDELISYEDDNGLIHINARSKIGPGDSVQILNGAFGRISGILESLGDQERVTILLNFMGRQVRTRTTLGNILAPC